MEDPAAPAPTEPPTAEATPPGAGPAVAPEPDPAAEPAPAPGSAPVAPPALAAAPADVPPASADLPAAPSPAAPPAPGAAPAGAAGASPPRPTPAARLPVGCGPLDDLLAGGIEDDAVTLVFGEGGSGKTNLALQFAREATARGRRAVFVDTEGVSAERLAQMFAADPEADMARVLFYTPYSTGEQERMVQKCTLVQDLGLVVVDSINLHYRLHLGDDEAEAARSLTKQLHHLANFARRHRVPVLVTGQVFGTEDATQPFARRTMEHLVKAAVRFEKRPDGTRRATLVKHRSLPEGRQALFRIGTTGLEPAARSA